MTPPLRWVLWTLLQAGALLLKLSLVLSLALGICLPQVGKVIRGCWRHERLQRALCARLRPH